MRISIAGWKSAFSPVFLCYQWQCNITNQRKYDIFEGKYSMKQSVDMNNSTGVTAKTLWGKSQELLRNPPFSHLNKAGIKLSSSMYLWRSLCEFLSDKCQRWEESRMKSRYSNWETPTGSLFCSFSIQENWQVCHVLSGILVILKNAD